MISFASGELAMYAESQPRPNGVAAQQRGSTTLAMSLVLLILITLVSAYTGRTVLFERKIAANDFRERQAFEAAESGLSASIAYISSPGGVDKNDDGITDAIFDTNADGIGDTNNMTLADNSSVTVSIIGVFPTFSLQSVGRSDDLTATRTVRTVLSTVDALPNAPDNPLTARGRLTVNGSATVHNPEGHSTIWSGDDVELGANNATATNIADPTDPNYPACMDTSMACGTTRSSSKIAVGLDVIEHDTSLSNMSPDQMFQNFFGTSMANYRESRVSLEVSGADANNLATSATSPGIHLGVGEVIWVEGNTSLTNITTVGCEIPLNGAAVCPAASVDPSIVIVNGNLTTSGTPNFYGLVYVIGNMNMSSNTTATGAIIVGGDAANGTGGSFDVWYNSDVLNRLRNNGPLAGAPGSWQDW